MKSIKKISYKIHLWIGTQLSILFFVVCFSGTIATISYELDWIFNKEIRVKPSDSLAARNIIVQNIKNLYPDGSIGYWAKPEVPYICDIIQVRQDKKRIFVFANPHTGEIQGSARITFKRFFRDLHYYLFIPNQVGHFLVLIFAFLLLVSTITALLFFKKWWRKLFTLKTGKGLVVFFKSLHKLIGLWSVPFSMLFAITGIWYFAERSNIGNLRKIVNPSSPKWEADSSYHNVNFGYTIDYDKALSIAQKEIPSLNLQYSSLYPGNGKGHSIYVRGLSDVQLVRQRANRVFINPVSYEVMKVQEASKISTVMWLNDIADPLHFGYWGGLTTKIIWFVFGFGISSLILTGIWTTLKKRASRRKPKRKLFGFWTLLNFGISGLILYYMWHNFDVRYNLNTELKIYISLSWMVFIGLMIYIFEYKIWKSSRV